MNRADPLLTDQYTLTMAQSFWKNGIGEEEAIFDLFVRRLPEPRSYLVAAGLADVLDYLEGFHFEAEDIEFLRSLGIYEEDFLDYLKKLTFTGTIRAVREGTILPAQAPIISVRAPRIQASIIESAVLAIINHQTMIASKTARIVTAAGDRGIWDFSLRRLHGPEAAFGVARASFIAGAVGTATVAAGREYGIPTAGTMAHHYVQSFGPDYEQKAFEQFMIDYPTNNTLLVDTYDTLRGVGRAVAASRATGIPLGGIRLDSGDLVSLSKEARRILDEGGCEDAKIFASNDLDEYKIFNMLASGAEINNFGVGTMLGTSADAPNLGGVFKLVAQEVEDDERPEYVMKLAADKLTDPGEHQLWALPDRQAPVYLSLIDEDPPQPDAIPLLETVMKNGSRKKAEYNPPTLEETRDFCRAEMESLDENIRDIHSDAELQLERSSGLSRLRLELSGVSEGE